MVSVDLAHNETVVAFPENLAETSVNKETGTTVLADAQNKENNASEAKLQSLLAEIEAIKKIQGGWLGAPKASAIPTLSDPAKEDQKKVDASSVFVGNVDYGATPGALEAHFKGCGMIERLTIKKDFNGRPKGFAYVQFSSIEGMKNALLLNESVFVGRKLQVVPKRTNEPGFKSAPRPSRGNGTRGRGGFERGGRGSSRRFAPY